MRFTLKKYRLILLFIFFSQFNFTSEDDYVPLSGLRDYFNGTVTSDKLSGNILLKTEKYSVVFNEMSTLYSVNGKIYPLNDPIIFKNFN